ncbi:hypothetical protein Tco_1083312 [Tanacetum coccineum]
MNAKLVWLREKYNYRSQTHTGGLSSHTNEICDVYLTEKELHQLHLDEEALRETLEEEARDEKEWEEKIRQRQTDEEEFMLNLSRIMLGPAGIVQAAKLLKQRDILLGLDGAIMSTQESMKKVVEDVGEDEDFKSEAWVSSTDYVNAKGGTFCSPNVIGDLTVAMKDLSVFSPKSSMHYLNITMRNVVKVFRKDTVSESDSD